MTWTMQAMAPAMELALAANFGSVTQWQHAFAEMASAAPQHPSRLVLGFEPGTGALTNRWWPGGMPEPAGVTPLLVIEVPADGTAAIAPFMAQIDWGEVYARYQTAVHDASEGLGATADELAAMPASARLLDVRRAGVYEQSDALIQGAAWRNPAEVAQWAAECASDAPVVVYCVYGHEVGRATALRLRAAGVPARFLEGGIDAWRAAGRPVMPKPRG